MSPLLGLFQTLVITAIIFGLAYKYVDLQTRNTHFMCPRCHSCFKLSKASFAMAFKKYPYKRMVTCPVCGYNDWMEVMKD